jgi:2-iminobutanoate/2-iminopropanoate deaminase
LIYQLLMYQHLKIGILIAMVLMMTEKSNAQVIETDQVYKTSQLGFSQAIVANDLVFTSGQVGWDVNYALVGAADFEAQAIQCFKNLDLILKRANSSIQNSIHLRFYVTDISDKNKATLSSLLKKYFPQEYQPTTTLLCVKALARKELFIELEAVAALNNLIKPK